MLATLCAVPVPALAQDGAQAGEEAPAAHSAAVRVEREAWAMGTRVRVLAEATGRSEAGAAAEAVLREIERVERLLSTWDAGSELQLVNAAPVGESRRLSPELAALLGEAFVWAERTARAFDPTVGPLLDAWDTRGEGRVPTEGELAAARASVGSHAIGLESGPGGAGAVRHVETAWLDSGAFGKGAALRSLARLPAVERVDRLLVDLGGQLWAHASSEAPWPVDVAHPNDRTRPVARLSLAGASVATSGASERPGHLLDPRSGAPAPDWGSVTVVSEDAFAADALSTALYVMGPEAGLAWARANGVAALFVETAPDGLRTRWSEAMDAWLVDAPVDAHGSGELAPPFQTRTRKGSS